MNHLVAYVAHPLAPIDATLEGIFWNNINDTKWCVDYLNQVAWPVRSVAPWIPLAEATGPLAPSAKLHRIIAADLALLSACDLLILIGNRVSNGMRKELAHANELGMLVINLVVGNTQESEFYRHMQADAGLKSMLNSKLVQYCNERGTPGKDLSARELVSIIRR